VQSDSVFRGKTDHNDPGYGITISFTGFVRVLSSQPDRTAPGRRCACDVQKAGAALAIASIKDRVASRRPWPSTLSMAGY
jgi:hypothetical protein